MTTTGTRTRNHRNTPGAIRRRKQAIRRRVLAVCIASLALAGGLIQASRARVIAAPLEPTTLVAAQQAIVAEHEPILDEQAEVPAALAAAAPTQGENEPEAVEAEEHDWFQIEATAYCACEKCCDQWEINRPNGIVYTANGAVAQMGVTIAADWDVFPPGTVLYIEGLGERIVQDRGGAINDYDIDVYFSDHQAALEFGRNQMRAYVVSMPE